MCGAASSAGDDGTMDGACFGSCVRARRFAGRTQALRAQAKLADLLDQVAAEGGRRADLAIASRLRNVVGGAERQRPQADLGVPPRQRGRHDHDEVALLFEQQRQRRDAVELRHVDVQHDHVGIDALELVYRLAAGAQRGDDFKVGFGFDPAGKQPAHDDGIVDEHDADSAADCSRTGRRRHHEVHWTFWLY